MTQGAVVKDMVAAIAPVVILILVWKEEEKEEKEERKGLRKRVFRAEESLSLVEEDSAVRTTMVRNAVSTVQYADIHVNQIRRASCTCT